MTTTVIDLRDVRSVTLRLLDHIIETRGRATIELRHNMYWKLPPRDALDIEKQPPEIVVGSLVDDWNFVSAPLEADENPVAFSLTELAPVLSYIGVVLGSELAAEGG